jgi:hypothetical protein
MCEGRSVKEAALSCAGGRWVRLCGQCWSGAAVAAVACKHADGDVRRAWHADAGSARARQRWRKGRCAGRQGGGW